MALMLPVITQAAAVVGSYAELARMIEIKPQAFYMWKAVPASRVLAIEAATGGAVSRHELRPDLYPPPATPSHTRTRARRAA